MYLLLIILFTIKFYAHIDIFKIVKRKHGQDLVTGTEEILIGKLHYCAVSNS